MNTLVVIPGRMAASRFPGKPLAKICNVPMIGHIYARAIMSKEINGVYVATPDREILDYIQSCGGRGGLEKTPSKNAITTVMRAIPDIEKDFGKKADWIIMVQGDEPMVQPDMIDDLALFIRNNPAHDVVNVLDNLRDEREFKDPNIVKAVLNLKGEIMWFFRISNDSWSKELRSMPIKKQTGLIAFKRDFLSSFVDGDKTPLEKIESVDMFRMIENGKTVPAIDSKWPLYSVDTIEDREFVEGLMRSDPLVKVYGKKYEIKD